MPESSLQKCGVETNQEEQNKDKFVQAKDALAMEKKKKNHDRFKVRLKSCISNCLLKLNPLGRNKHGSQMSLDKTTRISLYNCNF